MSGHQDQSSNTGDDAGLQQRHGAAMAALREIASIRPGSASPRLRRAVQIAQDAIAEASK